MPLHLELVEYQKLLTQSSCGRHIGNFLILSFMKKVILYKSSAWPKTLNTAIRYQFFKVCRKICKVVSSKFIFKSKVRYRSAFVYCRKTRHYFILYLMDVLMLYLIDTKTNPMKATGRKEV